jgi:hypothetical protein
MIEFRGEFSDECKRYIQKEGSKVAVLSSIIMTIITSIIIIIVGALWEWIVVLFILVPILTVVLVAIPKISLPMKDLNLYLPKKLIIEGEAIGIEAEKFTEIRSIT